MIAMDMIETIITECVRNGISPEAFFDLPGGTAPAKDTLIAEACLAAKQRIPRALQLFLLLRGEDRAKDVALIVADLLQVNVSMSTVETAVPPPVRQKTREKAELLPARHCKDAWKELGRSGISLTWLLFGVKPEITVRHAVCTADFAGEPGRTQAEILADYRRSANYGQYLSTLSESLWCVAYTGKLQARPTMERGLFRLMSGMPHIHILPEMPSPYAVYCRLYQIVDSILRNGTDIPNSGWMRESFELIGKTKWLVLLLLMISQSTLSTWKIGAQTPRILPQRVAFFIDRLLDVLGDREGLFFLMETLHAEALTQGYPNGLPDVLWNRKWEFKAKMGELILRTGVSEKLSTGEPRTKKAQRKRTKSEDGTTAMSESKGGKN